MGVNFEELDKMICSITDVIVDVEKEAKKIDEDIVDFREQEWVRMCKDFRHYQELAKVMKKTIKISISDYFPDYDLYFPVDLAIFPKIWNRKNGIRYDISNLFSRREELARDDSMCTMLTEKYMEIADVISKRFTEQAQKVLTNRADSAYKDLQDAKYRAVELGYMSAEEM